MRKAVTLIELLLVVTLSALLMTVIIPFIRSVNQTWDVGSSKTEILQNGRAGLEIMTRYIRQSARIAGIPGVSGNYVKLRDPNDTYNTIFYHNVSGSPYYIGDVPAIKVKVGDLVMRSGSTDSLLAASVTSLNFNFLKDARTSASKANEVRAIDIQMQLRDPLGVISDSLNLESSVCARQDVKISLWAINDGNDQLKDIAYETVVSGFNITNAASNCLAANPVDFSCWVADRTGSGTAYVKKVSSTGQVEWTGSGFNRPRAVSVNPNTSECWVADTGNNRIKKLSASGSLLWSATGFRSPRSVSVNPNTSECWVADTGNDRIKKLSSSGSISWTSATNVFLSPYSVSVNPADDTCWVADYDHNQVVRLDANGNIEWSISGFSSPMAVSVSPNL